MNQINLDYTELRFLPRIAEYIAFFHWIRFTLESVLRGDNRILGKIPDDIEDGLWWERNSQEYASWVYEFIH
jgi:hypothetical protein